jgi:hypothetical protein
MNLSLFRVLVRVWPKTSETWGFVSHPICAARTQNECTLASVNFVARRLIDVFCIRSGARCML